MKLKLYGLAALAATYFTLATAPIASAATYSAIDADNSTVTFKYTQMGVSMNGSFGTLSGNLNFDTNQPEQGKASFEIELASVDTGTADGDEEVVGSNWFAVINNPTASFESTSITDNGNASYDVTGLLNIKGQQQEITIPVSYSEQGDSGLFEGQFVIDRGDFNIGEGTWASTEIVASEVSVNVKISATK